MPVSNFPFCCDFHREQDCLCYVGDNDHCLCTGDEECLCPECPDEDGDSYLEALLEIIKMEEKR